MPHTECAPFSTYRSGRPPGCPERRRHHRFAGCQVRETGSIGTLTGRYNERSPQTLFSVPTRHRISELVYQGQYKLIMPAVHRESYLNGLRRASREGRFKIMVKVLHQMHCYTASLDWGDYGDAKATLQSWVEFIRRGNAPLLGMSE